jgi:hypothetical protein
MLSKTAMALVPAASLVGAAALAPTTSLARARTTVSSRQLSLLLGKRLGQQVSGRPSRPLSRKERS